MKCMVKVHYPCIKVLLNTFEEYNKTKRYSDAKKMFNVLSAMPD